MKYYFISLIVLIPILLSSQSQYNHPEIEWQTIETDHFKIHFYSDTEILAREAAGILEHVYSRITDVYQYEPKEKTHISFTDTEDVSNGVAYYYDNKMLIWASPLDIALRGNHKWLENVLTHEYTHIISIQKAMKAGTAIPGAYFQWIGYEKETHENVLYGYPNTVISYPVPGTIVPPWLAEGTAQYMYGGADWDTWDSHRDMILRDRALHDNLLSFEGINTFGKCGIGNESVYNSGYAFVNYIVDKFGEESIKLIMKELSNPFQFSIDNVLKKVTGIDGKTIYEQYRQEITNNYLNITESIINEPDYIKILQENGTTNLYPKWSNDGTKYAFISNKDNDYFSQTNLYVYDFETQEEEKVASSVHFAPSWDSDDEIIYYSKKPSINDFKGYRYYDIYSYNFEEEKETRLTKSSRAVSPVFIENQNSIAYIAMDSGKQSIFIYSLEKEISEKIKEFDDSRILHSLQFDKINNRLLFDYTVSHFRNIASMDLNDYAVQDIVANPSYDERDVCISSTGELVYSTDDNGIFNIVQIDSQDIKYITNVKGGAFLPSINKNGEILFSLYQNGGYIISLIEEPKTQNSLNSIKSVSNFQPPINNPNSSISEKYSDNFGPMFIMPRIMIDYGTFKPGFYFYSSEILEKLSLSGGASINFDNDLDLGFNLTYRKLYPTIYTDFIYATRNTIENINSSVYKIDSRLKFRFVSMQAGLHIPFLGNEPIDIYANWQRYRAFIKESIPSENLQVGYAYDYFQGLSTGIIFGWNALKPTVDREINPSKGFRLRANVAYEKNDFIEGLNLSNSGTLVEEFAPNNYFKIDALGSIHSTIIPSKRWTLSLSAKGGWLSNSDVETFFNYFGGGLDGIQGYPFYSFEGTNSVFSELALRIPLFRQKHIGTGWMIWQNSTLGVEYQFGDTWTKEFDMKQSIGLQLRLNGFSFYNYPTALGFEVHRGLTEFDKNIDDEIVKYGSENRYYLTLLFGF